jgi:hypothetical protein
VVSGAATAIYVSSIYPSYLFGVAFVQAPVALLAIVLIALKIPRLSRLSLALTAVALFLTPAVWSADAMNHSNSINPIAGALDPMGGGAGNAMGGPGMLDPGMLDPGMLDPGMVDPGMVDPGMFDPGPGRPAGGPGGRGPGGRGGADSTINADLVAFLHQNAAGKKYQVATFGGLSAAPYITQSDLSVLPIGGFGGNDSTPTLGEFSDLVRSGQLSYVIEGGFSGGMPGSNGMSTDGQQKESLSSQIDTWVSTNCQTVDYLGAAGGSDASANEEDPNFMPGFFGDDKTPVLYSCNN